MSFVVSCRRLRCLMVAAVVAYSPAVFSQDSDFTEDGQYRRAVEDKDNVKEKMFTKKGRVELNLPDFGKILNTAFVETYLVHGGLHYYTSEEWGFGLEGIMGINQDKGERKCLENFYNDTRGRVAEECGDGADLDNEQSNYGPAYMPIREIKYMLAANLIWNPIYGKQLMLMSVTSYFDFFITMGGGVAMSDFYEQQTELKNGNKARGQYNEETNSIDGGASKEQTFAYGEEGRPDPISETHPFINLGIGQKYHFWRRFSVKFEFRDMLLLGTPGGFENYFAIWTGFGIRL